MTGLRPWAKKANNGREAPRDEEVKQEHWPCPGSGRCGERPVSQALGTVHVWTGLIPKLIASPVVPGSCSLYGKE